VFYTYARAVKIKVWWAMKPCNLQLWVGLWSSVIGSIYCSSVCAARKNNRQTGIMSNDYAALSRTTKVCLWLNSNHSRSFMRRIIRISNLTVGTFVGRSNYTRATRSRKKCCSFTSGFFRFVVNQVSRIDSQDLRLFSIFFWGGLIGRRL